MSQLNHFWKVSIEKELQKNPKLKLDDIKELQQWASGQTGFPRNISDNQMIIFLHAASYVIEDAKTLMNNYYRMRNQFHHYFADRDPTHPYIQQTADVASCVIYGTDNEGRRCLWTKMLNTNANEYYPTTASKMMFMSTDVDHLEQGTVSGYTLIMNGKGFGPRHVLRCSFVNGKHLIQYVQNSSTILIDKIWLLYANSATDWILTMLKPFIKSDLLKKVEICPKAEDLFKHIPKESIPSDYGGSGPSIIDLNEEWKKKIMDHKEWLLTEEKERNSVAGGLNENIDVVEEVTETFEKESTKMQETFKSLAFD